MFTHTDQAARPACGHLPRRQATIAGSLGARSVRLGSLSALFSLWGGKAAGPLLHPGQDGTVPSLSETADRLPVSLVPACRTKTVYFIRHAQGFHNIGFEQNLDAHLTATGWRQTQALRSHLAALPHLDVQVVIASPLTRTLETASGVFGGSPAGANAPEALMNATAGSANECCDHEAIARREGPQIVANEACRERITSNLCDQRVLPRSRRQFPGVDFSLMEGEEDALWSRLNPERRPGRDESIEAVRARGIRFLEWLLRRPEERIAVVSHAGFLRHTLEQFAGPGMADPLLLREFQNCEMRCLVLAPAINGSTGPCLQASVNFPGGDAGLGLV